MVLADMIRCRVLISHARWFRVANTPIEALHHAVWRSCAYLLLLLLGSMLLTVVAIGCSGPILVEGGPSATTVTVDASIRRCRCGRRIAAQASAGLLLGSSAFHT